MDMMGLGLSRHTGGLVAAVAILVGCGGSQPLTGAPGAAPGQARAESPQASWKSIAVDRFKSDLPKYVYVADQVQGGSNPASDVLIYAAGLNGNISPSVVIAGSQTQLTVANGIVVDSSGEIYVADGDTNEIVGFAPGSSGNATPNIVISGSETGLSRPTGLAVDANDNLYVANCASGCGVGSQPSALLEYSAGSNGNVAPIRNITGYDTDLTVANDPAIGSDGTIYVSNQSGTICVFSSDANGDAEPIRELDGSYTLLDTPDGIAINRSALWAGSFDADYLERFKPDANGNVPPVAVISGKRTRLDNTDGISIDARGDIYSANPGDKRILEFKPRANGDVHPIGEIAGSKTQLVWPGWVFVQ
jgi:sugar lactone lactonase YvrE